MPRKLNLWWLLVLVLLLSACRGKALTKDPGLAQEDFGCGVALSTPATDAVKQASSEDGPEIKAVTLETLAQSDPYQTRDPKRDLLLAVSGSLPGNATGGAPAVTELRCYPADGEASKATLLGQRLRGLDANGADQLLGVKGQRTIGTDAMHLAYAFSYKPGSALRLELTLSFRAGQGCFAAKLKLAGPPPKL